MAEPSPLAAHRAAQARMLRSMAAGSQVLVMVALYVLWEHRGVPFWTAVEWCAVAGVAAYTFFATAAALLMAVAGLQPVSLFIAHLTRLASVGIFAALRYVHGLGLIRSVLTWLVIYLVANLIVRHIERRVGRRLGLRRV
jgi:hypothetical protein